MNISKWCVWEHIKSENGEIKGNVRIRKWHPLYWLFLVKAYIIIFKNCYPVLIKNRNRTNELKTKI